MSSNVQDETRTDAPAEPEIPLGLTFVDPAESDATFRVVLWGPPGEGKSVAAASAPDPIVVLSADRPGAYRTPRRIHRGKVLMETRYENAGTLGEVYRFLRDHPTGREIRTLVLDPFTGIYDRLVDEAPRGRDGDPDWQFVNKRMLGFLQSMRRFDINVVLVAYERLNDGKKGDGKLYPALGGPALISKVMGEMDIVAHVEREGEGEAARYMAQLAPRANLVGKDSTDALGERREIDLVEWFAAATEFDKPDESDIPWSEDFDQDANGEQGGEDDDATARLDLEGAGATA